MSSKLRALAFASFAVAVAMVPLYGDPRRTPVSHPEWARMLLHALDLDEAASNSDDAAVFATLAWKSSWAFRPERYFRASGVDVVGENGSHRMVTGSAVGDVDYRIAVVKGGDYRLRLRMWGNPAMQVKTEITPLGKTKPSRVFSSALPPVSRWVDAGGVHLDPGVYTASLLLPPESSLQALELVPPCLSHVEPVGGWKPTAITQTDDVAVTALRATDLEYELPPADTPIDLSPSEFLVEGPATLPAVAGKGLRPDALKGGARGIEASAGVDIKEAGLYTLYAFGILGEGQSWVVDSCRKAVICGSAATTEPTPVWRPVLTTAFSAGRHFLSLTLGRGGSVERLRIERKKDAPVDYLGTIRRLGFDPGPDGPVTRERAVEAMKFVRERRPAVDGGPCVDLIQGGAGTMAGAPGASIIGPAGPPLPTGTPPIGGQLPASPTIP